MKTNKQNLIFASTYAPIREQTWSYTTMSVYRELEKRYTIENFDIEENLWWRVKKKIQRKLGFYDLQSKLLTHWNRKFKKKYGDKEVRVFQFAECPCTDQAEGYIYQDLSVEYLWHLKQSGAEEYKYCGYTNVTEKAFLNRIAKQREFYAKCAGIFTMGQWLADYMVQECGIAKEKVHAVGAGINVAIETSDAFPKTNTKILFVGKDFERKGGPLVVEAFRYLRDHINSNAELYILGPINNPLPGEEKNIHFVGNVPREKVVEYYNSCDIFCMPSYFEAYGIVFAEALCYGLPCIARKKYAMQEIITEGVDGYLIESDDVKLLAEKMDALLQNVEIREHVRENRERNQEKYSWKTVVDHMKEVMDGNGTGESEYHHSGV